MIPLLVSAATGDASSIRAWLARMDQGAFDLLRACLIGLVVGLLLAIAVRGAGWALRGRARLRPPACGACGSALLGATERTLPARCPECGQACEGMGDPRLVWVQRGTLPTSALVTAPVVLFGGIALTLGTAVPLVWGALSLWRSAGATDSVLLERVELAEQARRQRAALASDEVPPPPLDEFCSLRNNHQAWVAVRPDDAAWLRGVLDGSQPMPSPKRQAYVLEMLANAMFAEALSETECTAVLARCPQVSTLLLPESLATGEPLRWCLRIALPHACHVSVLVSGLDVDGVPVTDPTASIEPRNRTWSGAAGTISTTLEPGLHRLTVKASLVAEFAGTHTPIGPLIIEGSFSVRHQETPAPLSAWSPFDPLDPLDTPSVEIYRIALRQGTRDLCHLHITPRFGATVSGSVDMRDGDAWRPIGRLRPRTTWDSISWIAERPNGASVQPWPSTIELRFRPELPSDQSVPRQSGRPIGMPGSQDWMGEVVLQLEESLDPAHRPKGTHPPGWRVWRLKAASTSQPSAS
ncbi:MAG: hypothetical protein JNL80_11270 [Phycisphaerae bacterium]|jgi:hypothetical protein|nr:hypothetical protein [Phycisphaerae bacterium]